MSNILLQLHALATTGFIIAAYLVFFSSEIIDSMLALIMAFIYAFLITLLTSAEFVAYLFVVIYVGAIAILFLFVIMMIDVKRSKKKMSGNTLLFGVAILVAIVFFDYIADSLVLTFSENTLLQSTLLFDAMNDIYYFSQTLFGYYSLLVLLAGIILLIAMLGAVTLTQNLNEKNKLNKNINVISEKKKSKSIYISLYTNK
jgi:NADH-quinone oxidoreductase subunit J